jgi:dihydroxyacetone kinase
VIDGFRTPRLDRPPARWCDGRGFPFRSKTKAVGPSKELAMKKLINEPGSVVPEMLAGLLVAYPNLRILPGFPVAARADIDGRSHDQVALISGGGSGHEPAHAGYVGQGMLSAAVAGDVFTSPPPDAVLAAIRAVTGLPGCLLIVKNYTGDRLNFGLAAERARAEGMAVEVVIVGDDVALADSTEHAGRRGLAGTILVHKIAGAAAAAGLSLAEVAAEARAAASLVRTMGVALTPCTIPAAGKPGFSLGDSEIEMGLGIHGEPGLERITIQPADQLVDALLSKLAPETPAGPIVLMVNGLGGTPAMELAIVARRAVEAIEGRGIAVERLYMGNFLTALEMAGVSLTILPVDAARLLRLDAATTAPAWPASAGHPRERRPEPVVIPAATVVSPVSAPKTNLGVALGEALRRAADALLAAEPSLTESDSLVGDGDLGISMARGARAILGAIPTLPLDDPSMTARALGTLLEHALSGTSGPLYATFFTRASATLARSPADWASAFLDGCSAISELGGARPGDRTMLDALAPAADAFSAAIGSGQSAGEALRAAAEAARIGAAATASLKPRLGRSSYLGDRALGHPDPGALAVAVWIGAIPD